MESGTNSGQRILSIRGPRFVHQIQAGTLNFDIERGEDRLNELLAFASRLNERRGYLHVSRVLGKHIPVRPSVMDNIHRELAEGVELAGTAAYVIGMAETATGLGAGVARHLASQADVFYQHTTRFNLGKPWLTISEAHSHAPSMMLARPAHELRHDIDRVRDLVLVDDEISTGRTLAGFIQQLLALKQLAAVERVHVVSIVSWLSPFGRQDFRAQVGDSVDVRFTNLMCGNFDFEADPDYKVSVPVNAATGMTQPGRARSSALLRGIRGARVSPSSSAEVNLPIDHERPSVVIGIGEFLDEPFQAALAAERAGADVLFQSSTRSPIAIGDCIASAVSHRAPGETQQRYFLYNPEFEREPFIFDGLDGVIAHDLFMQMTIQCSRQRTAS